VAGQAVIGPAFRLPMRFDPARLSADLALVEPDDWIPHFNTNDYEGDWAVVALRSIGGFVRRIGPALNDPMPYADTPHMARFSYFREIAAGFPMEQRTVRLMKLGPGAEIRPHMDGYLGYDDGLVRFHIPVQTNPKVEFMLDGRRLDMAPGETWYADFNLVHSVANRGETDRVHLVIDGVVNSWVTALFEANQGETVSG
jgi:hypothetical protein